MIEKLTAKEACDECALIEYWYESLDCNQRPAFDRWFGWLRERIAAEVRAGIDPLVTRANRERDEAQRERDRIAARLLDAEKEVARLKADIADEAACVREAIIRDALRDALKRDNGDIDDLIGCVRSLRKAFDEWLQRTEWVQERKNWGFPALGMHRADVMRRKIEELEAARNRVPELLEALATAQNDAVSAKARIRELEAASAKPAPRRTGGQKVRESLEYHAGHSGHDISDEAFALFAMEWGIPDEPEPPSDGELMRRAYGNGYLRDGDLWVGIADEFLKLRAERDGGGA